jgi:hypothetical protein
MEPDLEALRITQSRELAPGEEVCLLDGVLGLLDIAKDPVRDGVAAVTVEVDQVCEGTFVALHRLLDQPRSHWATSRLRRSSALQRVKMVTVGKRFNVVEKRSRNRREPTRLLVQSALSGLQQDTVGIRSKVDWREMAPARTL